MALKDRSNIFGQESTILNTYPEYVSLDAEATAAEELTNRLIYIAEKSMSEASDSTTWVATAANAGQNSGSDALVNRPILPPDIVEFAQSKNRWGYSNPTTTLPALPAELKVDAAAISANIQANIANLQSSWLAQYLPAVTDVTALNRLFDNVLDGSADVAADARLAGLGADMIAALNEILVTTRTALTAALATVQTNMSANFTNAATGIDSSVAIASDNTQNIAWVKARDQAAREAARNEAAAVSKWASRGFTLPSGALVKMQREAEQDTLKAAVDIAAEQAVKTQQLFFDAAKMSVDAYLRKMDAQTQAEIEQYKTTTDMYLRYAALLLDANKANLRTAFDHIGLRIDFSKAAGQMAVEYRLGVINGMNGLINAYTQAAGKEVDYTNSINNAKQRAFAAITDFYRATISHADWGVKNDLQNNEQELRFAQLASQFIGTAVGHHVDAAKTAADVFARAAGMALSGLNSVASSTTTQQL